MAENSGNSSSESGGKPKRKRKSKPTSKTRNRKMKVKANYIKAREEAQLTGLIPTTAEGAVHQERVDPALQGSAALPELVREALRESWATPDRAKPAIIAALLEPFFKDDQVLNDKGELITVRPSRRMLMELAKTLRLLDKDQWERDHPVEAGKARGGMMGGASGTTTINGVVVNNTQLNIEAAALIRGMIENGELGIIEGTTPAVQPPHQSSTSGNGAQPR